MSRVSVACILGQLSHWESPTSGALGVGEGGREGGRERSQSTKESCVVLDALHSTGLENVCILHVHSCVKIWLTLTLTFQLRHIAFLYVLSMIVP